MFYGCGNYKLLRKRGCNYFEWYDKYMVERAKDVIRLLKNWNDEHTKLLREREKNEELLKAKNKFMGYLLSLSLVFVMLFVFAFAATQLFK